jgi:4-amino-4-deoxy-L-arabinose transferase-like glycosyltransferase
MSLARMPKVSANLVSSETKSRTSLLSPELSNTTAQPASQRTTFFSHPRWKDPWVIFWTAFIVRVLVLTIGHTYRFKHVDQDFGFGWETGRIARSIALGHGFSSPFTIEDTGPTAWLAPIYPCILAGVFKIFGVYTFTSSWVILTINSFFSALNCIPIYYSALRCFGRKAALWSAWIWALLPYSMYYAIHWAWETALAALLLSCVFLISLRLAGIGNSSSSATKAESSARKDWLLFGLLWGLIALVNPSLLLWLPLVGVWLLWRHERTFGLKASLMNATLSGIIFAVILAPWTIRNYRVFHKFIPVRSNFGEELRLGNADDAVGIWRSYVHPSQYPIQLRLYTQMGEVAFLKMRGREASDFIRAHPGEFVSLCVKRFVYYWFDTPMTNWSGNLRLYRNVLFFFTSVVAFGGLWLLFRTRHRTRFLFASLLFAAPLLYYLTFPHPRYRHPIEPVILILGVYLFQSAEPRRQPRVVSTSAVQISVKGA